MSSIGFLEPFFLWGLLFLGVVLLLHLLKRPRTIQLAFSTLRFFSETAVAANRARKLRKWLLLLVRLLLISLLVLLFARPFDKNDPLRTVADPQCDLYVWIDPTPSMTYRENGWRIADRARNLIDSIAALRNGGTGVYLYEQEGETFARYDDLRDAPVRIKYGIDGSALGRAVASVLHSSKRPSLLVISDFQAATSAHFETIRQSVTSPGIPFVACPLTPANPHNTAITGVSATAGGEAAVTPRLRNYGRTPFSGSVGATVNNRRMPAIACSLPATTDTTLSLAVRRSEGDEWGRVTLTGDDPLEFDNSDYFAFGRTTAFRILIAGDPAANFPLAAALRAADVKRWAPECIAPEALTSRQCDSADILVISECRSIPACLQVLLAVRGPRLQSWIVAATGSDEPARLTASRILEKLSQRVTEQQAAPPFSIELPDTISGLWRNFPSLHIAEARVHGYVDGLTGSDVLCRFSNGKPAAIASLDPLGRQWIVLATPVGISTLNNLCETGFYVPFIDRIFRTAAIRLEAGGREPWTADMPVKNPWYGSSIPARLLDIDGKLLLQLQQQPVFTVATPGIYRVIPPSGSQYMQIVRPDTLESIPDYRLPASTPSRRWIVVSPAELLSSMHGKGRSLGWIVPWLLLALLVGAEVLLRERKR